MWLQLYETHGGQFADKPEPKVAQQLEALNHLLRLTRAERPVEVLSRLTPGDRARLLAVIEEGETMLADLRRRATEC